MASRLGKGIWLGLVLTALSAVALACSTETEIVEVVKEVPVEVVKTVVQEVPVEKIVTQEVV